MIPPDTVSGVEVHESNGFRVESSRVNELDAEFRSNGQEFQYLSVTADGLFKTGIEKGRPMSAGGGLLVQQRDTEVPMLTAADRNGDGRLDIITYTVLDEKDEAVLEVVDYEADGQADVRLHLQEGYLELWHRDRWYQSEKRDGRSGIVVDGEFKEIRNIDNRPTVQ